MDSGFPGTGFQYLSVNMDSVGFWIAIVRRIPDSLSCIPDSKDQDSGFHKQIFPDSGLHKQTFLGFQNPDPLRTPILLAFISDDYAPINLKPAGGGRPWGGDFTFFKNLQSNSLPTGKSFQSNATKFPHPRLHIAVNPKAEPKKGTIKISPNKTLQSFINVAASPKIHVPVTAAIIRFNHNPCYTA